MWERAGRGEESEDGVFGFGVVEKKQGSKNGVTCAKLYVSQWGLNTYAGSVPPRDVTFYQSVWNILAIDEVAYHTDPCLSPRQVTLLEIILNCL